MLKIEGRVIPSKVGPLLPLTHPAYYWRHPDDIFDFDECLRSGTRFLEGKYQQAVEPSYEIVTSNNLSEVLQNVSANKSKKNYHTVLTEIEFNELINKLNQAEYFSFDTETTSLNYIDAEIVGISAAINPDEAFYIHHG